MPADQPPGILALADIAQGAFARVRARSQKRAADRRRWPSPLTQFAILIALGAVPWTPALSQTTPQLAMRSEQASVDGDRAGTGQTGLLVSVVDDRGQALPGAEVSLRLGESDVLQKKVTDDDGRAEFEALATGEWQVDVRREGFMLFNAYVLLEPGRKPKVGFSSRQRTGSFWEPLQAVFLSPGAPLTRAVASGRLTAKEAKAQADRNQREADQHERRARRASQKGNLARVEAAPAPSEPTIRDLVPAPPEPETEEATTEASKTGAKESKAEPSALADDSAKAETPAVARTGKGKVRAREEPVSRSTPADVRAAPEQQPAEESEQPASQALGETAFESTIETTAEPAVESAVAARDRRRAEPDVEIPDPRAPGPAARPVPRPDVTPLDPPPRLLRNPNLLPAGTCPECQEGEFSVATRGQTAPAQRGGSCSAEVEALAAIGLEIDAALGDALGVYTGALAESNGNDVARLLPEAVRTHLAEALERQSASCQILGLVLPRGSRYVGYRYQAGERSVMAECPTADAQGVQECQVEDARWLSPPVVIRTGGVTLVAAVFENRSKRSTRLPVLTVYFAPPRGWLPPSGTGSR